MQSNNNRRISRLLDLFPFISFQLVKDVHPFVSFFEITILRTLSQDPPDQFSLNLYRMVGI